MTVQAPRKTCLELAVRRHLESYAAVLSADIFNVQEAKRTTKELGRQVNIIFFLLVVARI